MNGKNETMGISPIVETADLIRDETIKQIRSTSERVLQDGSTSEYFFNLQHLKSIAELAHIYGNELIHRPVEGAIVDQETAHLAEIAGYLHDADKIGQPFLAHHISSSFLAEKRLANTNLTQEQRSRVINAIVRHQGMPYVETVALAEHKKTVARLREKLSMVGELTPQETTILQDWDILTTLEPLLDIHNRFLPPNDEVSVLVYSADLLALGITHMEDEDPRAGAFDKIVNIRLTNFGDSLPDAIRSARDALSDNITRLKEAHGYTQTEKTLLSQKGFGEEEFAGREKAAAIERALGYRFGDRALKRINSLLELAESQPPEILQDTMECYYRLAILNAANITDKSEES